MADSKDGEKLDMILSHMDSVAKRLDAMEDTMGKTKACADAVQGRLDAMDKEKEENAMKDAQARKDAEDKEKEEEAMKDAQARADAQARKDAEDKEKEEMEAKKDQARKDAAETASNAAIAKQLEEINKRLPPQLAEQDRNRMTEICSRAERIHQAFGDAQGAPPWVANETARQYEARLASNFKKHSKAFKDADLSKISDDATFAVVVDTIYNDAYAAASSPSSAPEGTLREVMTRDRAGRPITKFIGDTSVCWAPFKQPVRYVKQWTTNKRSLA